MHLELIPAYVRAFRAMMPLWRMQTTHTLTFDDGLTVIHLPDDAAACALILTVTRSLALSHARCRPEGTEA